ncbi:transposase [Cohnella zeiphila]|uniref:Transposase n=1 Tax=Cohnella zeiphila TaxID=2761120 RepID=A0A7X0SS62_9BACL|nr:transposase [Cohnella zeiphila]MBB6735148.1 transposase [Cohnella zeiphila]
MRVKSRHRKVPEKKQLVERVLDGYRIEYVARTEGLHPETLREWVRQFRDEVESDMAKRKPEQSAQSPENVLAQPNDIEKKYTEAMKLLGEKELEIAILRDLLKKTNPTVLKDLK